MAGPASSGFPEALGRAEPQRRDAWFRAYLTSLVVQELRRHLRWATGEQLMPFEEHLWAVPLGVLWAGGAGAA